MQQTQRFIIRFPGFVDEIICKISEQLILVFRIGFLPNFRHKEERPAYLRIITYLYGKAILGGIDIYTIIYEKLHRHPHQEFLSVGIPIFYALAQLKEYSFPEEWKKSFGYK